MLGVFSGYIMQSRLDKTRKFWNYVIFGTFLILISLIWDNWHPIIKKLWTSSFVLFSGGICILLLALFYLIIDIWNVRRGTKCMIVLGSNAIFGYIAWHLLSKSFMIAAKKFCEGLFQYIPAWQQTLTFFCGFIILFILLNYMYKNKTFIKI